VSDFDSISDFLRRLEPQIHFPTTGEAPLRAMLEETVEELRVAIEELRVTNEEVLSGAGAVETEATRFREALTAAPMPFLLTDAGGSVRFANAAAAALVGVRLMELTRKPLAVFVGDESRRPFRRLLNELSLHGAPRRLAMALKPRGRRPLQVEAQVWPVPGSDGLSLAWQLTDVASHPDAQSNVRAEMTELRSMLDSVPVAMAALDLDGSVLVWNQAARELLGWPQEELAGRPFPAAEDLLPVLNAVRASGESTPRRLPAEAEHAEGGHVRVDLSLAPLLAPGGEVRGTVAVIRAAEAAPAPSSSWSAGEMRRVMLDASAGAGMDERLRAGIAAGLDMGYLRPGDRLPSIREAALAAGADQRAVSGAYQRLAAEGVVEVRYRRGVVVAEPRCTPPPELGEAAEWLAGVLEGAAELQVRLPGLPDLVRRWTMTVPLRCACLDATEDGRAALASEATHQWGMEAVPVDVNAVKGTELSRVIRECDVVLSTHFHSPLLHPVVEQAGRTLLVARTSPDVVKAVEDRLRRGPLTAVVVDRAFGERLRAIRGGEQIRVVTATDVDALAALDPHEPVLATLAAQERTRTPLRLLVPTRHMLGPVSPRMLARALIRANMAPRRTD